MNKKRGQAAIEVSVLIFLLAVFMIGYIILLPIGEREALLDGDIAEEDTTTALGPETLLSESPGKISSTRTSVQLKNLEPMRLFSTKEQATETLAASLTVSRSLIQNNYKLITFDIDNRGDLESLGLLFFISESKGDIFVELNGNLVYEGPLSSGDLPLQLPTANLQDTGNTLKVYTNFPVNVFSSTFYLMQDIKLVEEYRVSDKVSTRTFSVDDPGDVKSAEVAYFITCNSPDEGILTISLNNREAFSDRVFCEFLNERKLGLNADFLQNTNTLKFEITEGDYNVEEIEVEVRTKSEDFPTFTFDVNSDLYEEIKSGGKEVILKLSFGNDASEKISEVLVQEYSFRFDTEEEEYQKDITSFVDNGANTITLKAETSFEVENIKVFTQET